MIVPGSMGDWVQATVIVGSFVAGAVFLARSLPDEAVSDSAAMLEDLEEPGLVGVGSA